MSEAKSYEININLSCDEDRMSGSWNETHGDTVNADNIKSEITSWLEDLGFTVEFGETPNNLLQDAKALITDEDIEEVMNSDNSKEFDVGYYKGLADYHEKAKDILWEYIFEKDIPEIAERLDNLD